MTLLIGRQAILSKLPGIASWRTAKKFFKRHKIPLQYDESGKPLLLEEEIEVFWKQLKNKK